MTRETKIGLLVGLAFIIVIGILLSDHLTSATEPQQAQLAQVGGNVRNGVDAPGRRDGAAADHAGRRRRPTSRRSSRCRPRKSSTPKQPPVEIVQDRRAARTAAAGRSRDNRQPRETPPTRTSQAPTEPPITSPSRRPRTTPSIRRRTRSAKVAETFERRARRRSAARRRSRADASRPVAAAAAPAGRTAVQGRAGRQPLARSRRKLLGSDTKANRDAIIAANPSLQKNPNMVVARPHVRDPRRADGVAAPTPLPHAAPRRRDAAPSKSREHADPAPAEPASTSTPSRPATASRRSPSSSSAAPAPSPRSRT